MGTGMSSLIYCTGLAHFILDEVNESLLLVGMDSSPFHAHNHSTAVPTVSIARDGVN